MHGSWQLVPDLQTGDIKRTITGRVLVRGTTRDSVADDQRLTSTDRHGGVVS